MTEAGVDPRTGPVADRRRDDGRDVPEIVDRELAERLVAQAREAGVDLIGSGGLLRQMTKAVLERSLAAELTDHLGYVPGDPAGAGSGNNRNGSSPKRLATEVGPIELEVPRTATLASTRRPSARGSAAWTGWTSW